MKSPIHGVPIEQIVLVDRLTRRQKDFAHATSALPGHLIQLTTQGTAEYESEGQVFRLEPGVIVWFHDDQDVLVRVTQAPWSFLTVNFIMPHLPPPPFDQRIRRADTETRTLFERLFDAWRTNDATPPLARTIRVQAKLLDLIANILPAHTATFHLDRDAQIWWALEAQLRAHLDETVNLATLSKMSGRSARTLHRACHRATGLPPPATPEKDPSQHGARTDPVFPTHDFGNRNPNGL
jgi:AraC-like DNA-binding protein